MNIIVDTFTQASASHSPLSGHTASKPDAKTMDASKKFEAAFIAQMLQFSGLSKALTSEGGESVDGFTQFYLEALAEDLSENGGFGLSDVIYENMRKKETANGELGRL